MFGNGYCTYVVNTWIRILTRPLADGFTPFTPCFYGNKWVLFSIYNDRKLKILFHKPQEVVK